MSRCFGVSCCKQARASPDNRSPYFFTTLSASLQVDESAQAGPLAIISSGSPRMSLSTMQSTCAGAQACANRPPFTADSRLRMVLISTISAPQARSWPVMSCNSDSGTSGCSSRALPPPESRNTTVSCAPRSRTSASAALVPRQEPSSGMGCPPSKHAMPASGPLLWPYFVMTTPRRMRPPRQDTAAWAICHAALPAATRYTPPVPKSWLSSARMTATSGSTAWMPADTIFSASSCSS